MAAVQRNLAALFMYVGIFAALGLVAYGLDYLVVGTPARDQKLPLAVQVYGLVKQFALVILQAIIQAVIFARMGKEIDKPLWRNDNDWTALRRFFNIWFTLGLIEMAVFQFVAAASTAESGAAALFLLLFLFISLIKIPVGACIMFAGAREWRRVGKDLAPLGALLPKTLLLVLISFFVFMLVLYAQLRQQEPFAYNSMPGRQT